MQNVQNTTSSAAQNDEFELDVQITTFDNDPAPMRPTGGRTTITGAPMRPPTGHTTITGRR